MPAGGVQDAELVNECAVTSISLATPVVTLGVSCVRPLAVFCQSSTSIGLVVLTPEND